MLSTDVPTQMPTLLLKIRNSEKINSTNALKIPSADALTFWKKM
jgi:hypothetical protein